MESFPNNGISSIGIFLLLHEEQKIITSKQWVDDVWHLLEMTPYRYKSPKEGLERVKACAGKEITFEFVIDIWRRV